MVCAEDGISLTCSTLDNVGEEICDGIDNDCDGEVDEGFNAPLADKQDGVCVGATKVCGAGDGWVEPDYTLIENYEERCKNHETWLDFIINHAITCFFHLVCSCLIDCIIYIFIFPGSLE